MTDTNPDPNPKDPAPTPPPEPPKPKVAHADDDQAMANDISDVERVLLTAKTDPQVQALLAPRSYGPAQIEEGLNLQKAAQEAFNTRRAAKARARTAQGVFDMVDRSAREHYADFRKIARTLFLDKADQTALGLTGKIPTDDEKFITAARASYNAALKAPFADKVAKYGYRKATLKSDLAELDSLSAAGSACDKAVGAATGATQGRNQAYGALMKWMKQFKGIARVALRQQPDQRAKLGL